MKIGLIISQKQPETVWNAFRFGNFALGRKHVVKIFLLGEGVECEEITDQKFNVRAELNKFIEGGGEVFACGSCLKSRRKGETAACPLSTMADLLKIVEEADRVVTF